MATRMETLDTARSAVTQRADDYGKPEDLFGQIAERWALHLRHRYGLIVPINATDVAAMMIEMKQARAVADPAHADTWADIAGYAACGSECSDTTTPNERRE